MNNKELIATLAKHNQLTQTRSAELLRSAVEALTDALCNGDAVNITNFGLFDVKKHSERIIVNPVSKKRTLIPPKLAATFKPATRLKSNIKNSDHEQQA